MANLNRKHLCFILPSLVGGGMERVMCELANNFVRRKDVKITIVLLRNTAKFYSLDERINIVEPKVKFNKNNMLMLFIRTIFFTRKSIKEINPDIILSFGEKWNSYNLLSLLFTKYKIVVSDRSSPKLILPFFHAKLRVILYKNAYGIIAQTNEAKKHLDELINHKNIITIGNPIKELKEIPVQRENTILNVGRFISTKQQLQLVEIFSSIENTNWKLVFIGDGFHLKETQQRAIELGVSSRVEFLGEIKDVDTYYKKSKIFAFTSVLEGFPNALGEALSAPLACISYDCHSGARDLIRNDYNGYLININNTTEYKYKLELLMEDENIRNRFEQNAKLRMKEYSIDDISDKYYNFLVS